MLGMRQTSEVLNRIDELSEPFRQRNIFNHLFKSPVSPGSLLIVLPDNREIGFARNKIDRLLSLFHGAKTDMVCHENADVELPETNGRTLRLSGLLSKAMGDAMERGELEKRYDAIIVLSPVDRSVNLYWVRAMPLYRWMEERTDRLLYLANSNYLGDFVNPLNDRWELDGKSLYGYALLFDGDRRMLEKYGAMVAGGVAVEIGRFMGGSSNVLASVFKESGKRTEFHSFDIFWAGIVEEILSKNRLDEYVTCHQMSSMDGFAGWDGGELDLLFIDADHSYEGVKADIANWGGLVKKGGDMLLHDYVYMSAGFAGGDVANFEEPPRLGFEFLESAGVTAVFRRC